MISESYVTVIASKYIITSGAGYKAGITPAIQKQNGLLALVQNPAKLRLQGTAKDVQALAGPAFLAKINDLDLRHGQVINSLW